jgi:hypothetical protein
MVAWGLSIAAFGLAPWLAASLVFLALAGAADVVSAVFRNTILQLAIPDSLRGRLSATHIAVVSGGPRLGDVEAGAVDSTGRNRGVRGLGRAGLRCDTRVVISVGEAPLLRDRQPARPPAF